MQKPGRRSLLSIVQSEIQKKRFKSFVSQNQRSGTLKPDMNTERFIKRYRELIYKYRVPPWRNRLFVC